MKRILGIVLMCLTLLIPTNSEAKELEVSSISRIIFHEEAIDLVVPDQVISVPNIAVETDICSKFPPDEDVNLIAWIAMGEAEGESEEGKRLVIDTILNRVDSSHFPDTIEGVIFQQNAFSCTQDGRLDRCTPNDEVIELVYEELENRTNDEVIFFNANHYSAYGEPMFIEGNHYFSSYGKE